MARVRTWWGERFIEAVETFTDEGRLSRGRSYATNGRILDWAIKQGKVVATVRGSVNPYFGVYKEPRYRTTIVLGEIAAKQQQAVIEAIGHRADLVTRLLMGEMPEAIEAVFEQAGTHLLPSRKARLETDCSCPDWSNPCKHVAGLYYLLARLLDRDPFLMFELRGLTRETLRKELLRTPLGQALAAEVAVAAPERAVEPGLFPAVGAAGAPEEVQPRAFWQSPGALPEVEGVAAGAVPALTIKREGDFPAFWPKDASFLDVMEEFYGRVRKSLG